MKKKLRSSLDVFAGFGRALHAGRARLERGCGWRIVSSPRPASPTCAAALRAGARAVEERLLEHRVRRQVGVRELHAAAAARPAPAAPRCRARPASGCSSRGRSASGRCGAACAAGRDAPAPGRRRRAAPTAASRRSAGAPLLGELGGALAAERPVGGEHGRPGERPRALVHRVDVAERRRCRRRTLSHDGGAPGRSSSGARRAAGWRPARAHGASRATASRSAGGGASSKRAATNSGVASDHARRASSARRCCVAAFQASTLDVVAPFVDAQHDAAGVQALAERRGQPLGQPGVAFGPGEDAVVAVGRRPSSPGASKPCRLAK